MRSLLLVLVFGCTPPPKKVEETPRCSSLSRADDRHYCNGRCELIEDASTRNECLFHRRNK